MMIMSNEKMCQVCGKPISEGEMCLKKDFRGRTYNACCPMCFSILQKDPEKYILTAAPDVFTLKTN
jgi:YHS domain-containing protein